MISAADDQFFVRYGGAEKQGIQPMFAAVRALIFCDPGFARNHVGNAGQPRSQAAFVGIGEVPPTVLTLAGAIFEAQIKHAARFQCLPEAQQAAG